MSNPILLQQSRQLGQILIFETRAALAHRAKHIIRIIIRLQQESTIVSPPSSPSGESPDHREIHRILHLRLVVPLVFYPVPATGTGLVERVRTKGFDHQPLTAIRNSPFNVGVKLVRLLHDYLIRETQSLPDTHKVSKNPPTLRISDPSIICPVSIQEIEYKNPDWYLFNRLFQLILSTS